MTTTEKVIVTSTIVMGASAITMLMLSKKYNEIADDINSELGNIRYTLSKSREDLILINKETAEGNKILRKLVKDAAENIVDNASH